MGNVRLNPPDRRACLRCGRRDIWDTDASDWKVEEHDGEKQAGSRFCLHEWDITGSHTPIITD